MIQGSRFAATQYPQLYAEVPNNLQWLFTADAESKGINIRHQLGPRTVISVLGRPPPIKLKSHVQNRTVSRVFTHIQKFLHSNSSKIEFFLITQKKFEVNGTSKQLLLKLQDPVQEL